MTRKILSIISVLVIFISTAATFAPSLPPPRNAEEQLVSQEDIDELNPPWLDTAWSYRRAVTVSNGSSSLVDYQVLVTLDSSFVFSHASSDGSDLRVTSSNGTTLLKYWIETWDAGSQLAYVWVKLPSIPSGDSLIYLYYGNASATAESNGETTFDFFDDDWCQYPGSNCSETNPVHSAGQPWWESAVSYPMVFEDTNSPTGHRYHMLYDGHNVIGHAKGYAWSEDLIHWTEYDAGLPHPPNPNPIMGTGYAGGVPFAWGDTIKVGSTYYMFASRNASTTQRIESTDLVTWTNFTYLTVVNDPGGIGTGAAVLKEGDGITPILVDGKYWMVYFHGASPGSMYIASSSAGGDLGTWTSTGTPILTPTVGGWDASGLWTPSFARFGDQYYIYYQGNGPDGWETGFARADAYSGGLPVQPSLAVWSKSDPDGNGTPDPVIKNGLSGSWDSTYVIDPMVRHFSNDIYYVFYTGNVANGFAYANNPDGPWTKLGAAGKWTTVAGSPTVSGGILTLLTGVGVKSTSNFQYQAVGYRANFGLGNGGEWAGFINGSTNDRVMIGDSTTDPNHDHLYQKNYVPPSGSDIVFPGSLGQWQNAFHVFEARWQNGWTGGLIDHGAASVSQTSQVPTVSLPITLYSYTTSSATLLVDWVYVRQYRNPEPATQVGVEQAAVDLEIVKSGEPDLVYAGEPMTYTLSITNSWTLTASSVTVTDTLPGEVLLASAEPSQGSCSQVSPVVCDLWDIPGGGTAVVTILVTTTIEGSLTNTAEIASADYDLNEVDNLTSLLTDVAPAAELVVSKEDSQDPVRQLEPFTYTLTVQNMGPSDALGVLLTDTLPVGVSVQEVTPGQGSCEVAGLVVSCDLEDISADLFVEVEIGVIPLIYGEITNHVEARSSIYEGDLANNADSETTMVLPLPDLVLTMEDQPDPLYAGDLLTYTLSIANDNPALAPDVILTDTLPGTVLLLTAMPSQGSCSQVDPVVCELGDIPGAGDATVTIVVSTTIDDLILNTATVVSSDTDLNPADNSASETTLVNPVAELTVSKVDSQDPIGIDIPFFYTILVENTGPSPAESVVLTDTLPEVLVLEYITPTQGSCSGIQQVLSCDLLDISPGASAEILIGVLPEAEGVITNTVSTGSSTYERNTADNADSEMTTITPIADLSVTMDGQPDPVLAGSTLTYTIVVSNMGPSQTSGVILVDSLPGGVTFLSSTPGSPVCNADGQIVTCALGSMPEGDSTQVAVLVRVLSSTTGQVINSAFVSSDYYDPAEENNQATVVTPVSTSADLLLDLVDDPDPVLPGDPLTMTLTITNAGPSDALWVNSVYTLPVGVIFENTDPQICTAGLEFVTCLLETLAGGDNYQIRIFLTVDSDSRGVLLSYAKVISSATQDPELANNDDSDTTQILSPDTEDPTAHWVEPVTNEHVYMVAGEVVHLMVTATDNAGVNYVWINWYDNQANEYIDICFDYQQPYECELDTSILYINDFNQLFAVPYDLSGNYPDSNWARILLYRFPYMRYLPMVVRQ